MKMLKISLWRKMAILLLALVVSACGGAGGSAQPPAGGLMLTPGNGQVTVTWTADPGVQYWLMYAPTTGADVHNLTLSLHGNRFARPGKIRMRWP